MLKSISFFLLSILFLQLASEWVKVESDEGQFSILMPIEPEHKEISEQPFRDGLTMKVVEYQSIRLSDSYTISCAITPEKGFTEDRSRLMLEMGAKSWENAQGHSIVEKKEINIDGNPGLYYKVSAYDKLFFYSKAYVIDNRIYQLYVSKTENVSIEEDSSMNKFFNSFEYK